jgi:hypothetical protein
MEGESLAGKQRPRRYQAAEDGLGKGESKDSAKQAQSIVAVATIDPWQFTDSDIASLSQAKNPASISIALLIMRLRQYRSWGPGCRLTQAITGALQALSKFHMMMCPHVFRFTTLDRALLSA